jgi:membrane-bound serine protease (ClpP class)
MRFLLQILFLALLLLGIAPPGSVPVAAQPPRGPIYVVEVQGIVTSVTVAYLRRALTLAEAADANVLIIQLGSSGGVLAAMRPFATELARARVPVVVYVAPPGTQAGAAGALFLSAAHLSAVAPNTSFGSPVPLAQVDATLSHQTRDLVLDSVAAQLRAWNAARGRNTAWVERAVRAGVILSNDQASALQPPAIDLVAADQAQLLTLLEGRVVTLADGREVVLATLGQTVSTIEPTLWEGLRLALADPTIAFVLLVLGALAIYVELAVPGTSLFAGIGVVLLAGAAAGLLVLPIRWWSLIFILLALGLVGAEHFAPTHGALAVGGVALMVVGALTLIDPAQAPGVRLAGWIVPVVALGLATSALISISLAVRSRRLPVVTGVEALIGRTGVALSDLAPRGMVKIDGEVWSAVAVDEPIARGEQVAIVNVEGVTLRVQALDPID